MVKKIEFWSRVGQFTYIVLAVLEAILDDLFKVPSEWNFENLEESYYFIAAIMTIIGMIGCIILTEVVVRLIINFAKIINKQN